MKKLTFPLITLLVLCTVSSVSAQIATTTPQINKIIVTGSYEMEVEPDEIFVNFNLREFTNNKKEKVGIESIRKEFLDACSRAGIAKENISVEGVSGSAYNNWYIRKRRQEPDFKASITYIIKFSSSQLLDKLIPELNDDALTNMYISKKSHSKMEAFRKEVKIKATQSAKEKASYLAESIGEKVKRAILIEEVNTDGYPVPMMMKMSNMAGAMSNDEGYGGDSSMPFEKIKIRYEIRAEFELM